MHGKIKIYFPSQGPDSWRALLADPLNQWSPGYSAQTLAHCWEAAQGCLPEEVASLFAGHGPNPELLLALPEHKVPLPGSTLGESQSDVFALIRVADKIFAAMIEGKVDEPFDSPLGKWLIGASLGEQKRLKYICDLLDLKEPLPNDVYYQLLHRTASAIIEARRFRTDAACMIVHSFSPTKKWFDAFQVFASLFNVNPDVGCLLPISTQCDAAALYSVGRRRSSVSYEVPDIW